MTTLPKPITDRLAQARSRDMVLRGVRGPEVPRLLALPKSLDMQSAVVIFRAKSQADYQQKMEAVEQWLKSQK